MKAPKDLIWQFVAEFIGTALLLAIGLSFVIFDFGGGSIVAKIIPSVGVRRLITGFLFGSTGCLVTLSPVGKVSGAHINPAVSFAFWLRGKMNNQALAGYVISQMLGAVAGCYFLLLWKSQGSGISFGNTVPGVAGFWAAFAGEVITTSCLITVIFTFVGNKRLRDFTPYTMAPLYCFMVWAEGGVSGCSTNPARSFGPAVISGVYTAYWLYVIAPLLGSLLTVFVFKKLRLHHYYKIESARISFHDEPSPQSEPDQIA